MKPKKHAFLSLKFPGVIFIAISLLCAMLLAAPASYGFTRIDDLVAKVQEGYENIKDLSADFTQDATVKSVDQTIRESGIFNLKKPGRMLWDYKSPSPKKLVVGPDKAWLYVPDDNMVYVQDSKSLLSSKVAMKFLMGVGDLREDFEVGFPDSGSRDAEGNYLMHLVPKSRESGVENILLTVDKGNFFVRKFEFSDVYGNTTTLVLDNIKINTNLPDGMFNFVPPPGVELYEVP